MDCSKDQKAFKRLNAIHLLLICAAYEVVQRNSRVSLRTFRLWISRFNQSGIDGLSYRPQCGRPRLLSSEAVSDTILPLVDEPSQAGQTHWTARKLCGHLNEHYDLKINYRTLVRYLHEHDYKRKIPRPMPVPKDPEKWEEQREEFAGELLNLLENPNAKVFFGDEAGFEGDPRPRAKWTKRGSRPTQGYYGSHVRKNVVGAVNPADGNIVSLIVHHNNTDVFQVFLNTMAKEVPAADGEIWLILDNASWHKSKSLNWHHIKPKFLPAFSPDFNPIERLWQHLKSHYLAGYLTNSSEELSEKILTSIQDLLANPEIVSSVCNTHSP